MAETEDEERYAKHNANKVTTNTLIQPPITTNEPREKIDVTKERRISSDSLTETIKGFHRLTLQSTINDDHSKKCRQKQSKK